MFTFMIIFIVTTGSSGIFGNDCVLSKVSNAVSWEESMGIKHKLTTECPENNLVTYSSKHSGVTIEDLKLLMQCDTQQSNITKEIYVTEEYGTLENILQESISCPLERSWRIIAPKSSVLNLTFTYFRLRHCSDDCLCDNLTIYDSDNHMLQTRGQYCGVREPWYILTKWNIVMLKLVIYNVSESYYEKHLTMGSGPRFRRSYDELTGFIVLFQLKQRENFRFVKPVEQVTFPSGQLNITTPHMIIHDVRIHHWHIRVEYDRLINLSYDLLDCFKNNYVSFHDGPTERHAFITRNVKTRSVQSTGFHLYVILEIPLANKPCISFQYYTKEIESSDDCDYKRLGYEEISTEDRHGPFKPRVGKWHCALERLNIFLIGPNHDDCAYQGVVMWHGANKTKIGPFCGIDTYKQFSHYTNSFYRLSLPNIIATVLAYSYEYKYDSYTEKGYAEFQMSHIREHSVFCSFISNWDNIDHRYVDYKVDKNKNVTFIKLEPKRNWCFLLYFPPSNEPIHQNLQVEVSGIQIRSAFLANNIASLRSSTGCNINNSITQDLVEKKVTIYYNIECSYTPIGFRVHLDNVNVCETKPTVRRTSSSIEGLGYGDKWCGQPDNTKDDVIYIQALPTEVYYLFKLSCRSLQQCLDTTLQWEYEYYNFMTFQVVRYNIKRLPVVLKVPGWLGVHIKFKLDPIFTLTYEKIPYTTNVTNTPSLEVFNPWNWVSDDIEPYGTLREIIYQEYLYSVCWREEILNWNDANNFCNSLGSHLLYITSETEFRFVRRFLALAEQGIHILYSKKSMAYFLNMKVSAHFFKRCPP